MKISLCNEVLAEYDFAQQCDIACKLGYDGIELAPLTVSDNPHLMPAAQRSELRRIAADSGVPITGLHYILRAPAGLSITSRDKAQRERTIEVMKALCDLAADLGARTMVHGSPDQRRLEAGNEIDGRRRAIDCWAAMAPTAEQAGVVYCIEALAPPAANFINTVEEAVGIVKTIGSPAIVTMIDCSAAGAFEKEPVADLIRRYVPTGLIGHMHFNDPNRRGPGDGVLQYGPILKALSEVNYRGNAGIEPFVYIPNGLATAARNIGYIRGVLDGISRDQRC
jgi:D-psicose/D-tagatose/L-ribulose 3-epimerase